MCSETVENDKELALDSKLLDLHSRQIGTYGIEAMTMLLRIKVIIVGISGSTAEAAKNLCLAGVHSVTLIDNDCPTATDCGVNFCFNEDIIRAENKRTKAELTATYIRELNPSVKVTAKRELTEELVSKQCTVLVISNTYKEYSYEFACRWNNVCRKCSDTPAGKRVSFVLLQQTGPVGTVFVDHGENFACKDTDGRPAVQKLIMEMKDGMTDKKGRSYTRIRFMTPEGMQPGSFDDFSTIQFTSVPDNVRNIRTGLHINNRLCTFQAISSPLDHGQVVRIYPSLSEQGFRLFSNDGSASPIKLSGGFVSEVKKMLLYSYSSLSEALVTPKNRILEYCFTAEHDIYDGFLFFEAYMRYLDRHDGCRPPLHDKATVNEFIKIGQELNAQHKESLHKWEEKHKADQESEETKMQVLDPEIPLVLAPQKPKPFVHDSFNEQSISFFGKVACVANAELQPLSCFFGAILCQEIVKVTGKFAPIFQFFTFSVAEVLPDYIPGNSDHDGKNVDYDININHPTRSDYLTTFFGKAFVYRIRDLKLFMAGCGALGCENIKNFALNDMCVKRDETSKHLHGHLVVTDNDRIEVSNLSRQFLFREENVGQFKSVAAAKRSKDINPRIHITSKTDYVGKETYDHFPDSFWMGLDAVVNALDNMQTRFFIDDKCVLFKKILVEAGTMGTSGNVDIIIPGVTASYSDGGAADQTGGIPMCTLRNFPYIYDHCIEWAKSQFDDLFVFPIQQTSQLFENPNAFVDQVKREIFATTSNRTSVLEKNFKMVQNIQTSVDQITGMQTMTMRDCMELAWKQLHLLFRDNINNLIMTFPRDAKKHNGELFWTGHHNFPQAIGGECLVKGGTITNVNEKHDNDETQLPIQQQRELVIEFLIAATNLYACMFGIHESKCPPKFNDPHNRWKKEYRTQQFILQYIDNAFATNDLYKETKGNGTGTSEASTTKGKENENDKKGECALKVPLFVPSYVEGLDDETENERQNGQKITETDNEATMEQKISTILSRILLLVVDYNSKLLKMYKINKSNEQSAAVDTVLSTIRRATPLTFEKDDDDNFHIDFVSACANLRAANYHIKGEDKMKVKIVAGKIIPAIATTTAAVTGLALIELFKTLRMQEQEKEKETKTQENISNNNNNITIEKLKNININIGTNAYSLFEPDPPKKNRTHVVKTYLPEQDYTYKKMVLAIPEGFNKYDRITTVFDLREVPSSANHSSQSGYTSPCALSEADGPSMCTRQTTISDFANTLLQKLEYLTKYGNNNNNTVSKKAEFTIDSIGVGKGLIWNGIPNHKNYNRLLLNVIEEQMMIDGAEKALKTQFVVGIEKDFVGDRTSPAIISPASGSSPSEIANNTVFFSNRLLFDDLQVNVSVDNEDEITGNESVDEIEVVIPNLVLRFLH